MDNKQNKPNKPNPENDRGKHIGTAVIVSLALILLFTWVYNTISNSQYTQTTYSDFMEAKETGNLAEVEIRIDRILYMTREEAEKDPSQQRACYTGLPVGDYMALANELDFKILGLTFSPVKGPEGNIEFLAHLTLAEETGIEPDTGALVAQAHEILKG